MQVPDPEQVGRYYALAQVGLEMAAPVGIGWLIDNWLDSSPWGIIVGALLGLTAGILHLAALGNRARKPKGTDSPE